MNPYNLDLLLGSGLCLLFLVYGLFAGPLLSLFLHSHLKYVSMRTKQEIVFAPLSLRNFLAVLVVALWLTVSTFFVPIPGTMFTYLPEPRPIGLLFFIARYGSAIMVGAMIVSHLLLKHVKPLRRALYRRAPQTAVDLYAP